MIFIFFGDFSWYLIISVKSEAFYMDELRWFIILFVYFIKYEFDGLLRVLLNVFE